MHTAPQKSFHGLTESQATERLKRDGPNELPHGKRVSIITIFLRQFANPLIYVLLGAAVLIFFISQHRYDAFIVSGVLLFNAILGTIQEGRTRAILESLQRFLVTKSVVIRDGKSRIVPDAQLVIGDIIFLQAGDRVPADARILRAYELTVNEALLTGESEAVIKKAGMDSDQSLVFRGTFVLTGEAYAEITATGVHTRVGHIHRAIEDEHAEVPLQRDMDSLAQLILVAVITSCSLLLFIGLAQGQAWRDVLMTITALFICLIPEGLPVVLTIVLVTGAYRLAHERVLVKQLRAVEGLGRTTTLVLDKTGTLTRNEMMVCRVLTHQGMYVVTGEGYHTTGDILLDNKVADVRIDSALQEIGRAGLLLNSTQLSYEPKFDVFEIKGDPTQAALGIFGLKVEQVVGNYTQGYHLLYEIPFESDRRYQAGLVDTPQGRVLYLIGAPEFFLAKTDISTHMRKQLDDVLRVGYRIVGAGKITVPMSLQHHTELSAKFIEQIIKKGTLEILGFVAMQDAVRRGVKEVIERVRNAGLTIVLATGDHLQTALRIAQETGILPNHEAIARARALNGTELEQLSDHELAQRIHDVAVFARVKPLDKVRIIRAFQAHGEIVGMTGDGVNDVPSLVAANLGIAMGSSGTEVAKEAGDLILLDDSLMSIINGITEGRHLFITLRRVMIYYLSTNLAEFFVVLVSVLFVVPLPFSAVQILWLNLITDGFLDVGLSMEPPHYDAHRLAVIPPAHKLLDMSMFYKTLYLAIPMAVGTFAIFWWCYWHCGYTIAYAQTMGLTTLVMYQWFNGWNCRSHTLSIAQIGFFSNRLLAVLSGLVIILQGMLLYTPFMQKLFRTVPLSLHDWAIILALTTPAIIIDEVRKWVYRRYKIYS